MSEIFMNPQFLPVAAALISVPIIIHLINRLRFKRIRWAAMEFLLKAQKRNRRRLIIEQLLLLGLRCLLVGLVGVLVMRVVGMNFADMGVKQSVHIVLLDDSLSMQDRWKKGDGYTNCFEEARDEILIKKIGHLLSQSKTADKLIVLPLSRAQGEVVFSQKLALTSLDEEDKKFGPKGGKKQVITISQPLEEGMIYSVRLDSEVFKGHLRVFSPTDRVLANDDEGEGRLNAGLEFTASETGQYKVVVASHDEKVGNFQIEVSRESDPLVYEPLTEFKKFEKEMGDLKPTKLHLNLLHGVRRARSVAEKYPKAMITFHILSDFRRKDWGDDSSALHKELLDFSKDRKAEIRLLDTLVDPARTATHGAPAAHENIGIVDLKPRSRVVGRGMPVTFTLTVANYGPETSVNVDIYDVNTGQRKNEVDFNPPLPLKLAKGINQATFELKFTPDLEENESRFEAISAHLKGKVVEEEEDDGKGKKVKVTRFLSLEKDGLQDDNVGYGVVEVRKQVPVLIIDGLGKAGYDDRLQGKDSFFLEAAFLSVAETKKLEDDPFRVDLPFDPLPGKSALADATQILDDFDNLRPYPAIIMCNVAKLSDEPIKGADGKIHPSQLANLERYVREGGGLAIFMGPKVDTEFYNGKFFNDGRGIFPAKLQKTYFPKKDDPQLKREPLEGVPMLLVRDEDSNVKPFPIFSSVIKEAKHRRFLNFLPIYRYFPVESRHWLGDKAKNESDVLELATLPNDYPIETYQTRVMDIVQNLDEGKEARLAKLLSRPEFGKYKGKPGVRQPNGVGFEKEPTGFEKYRPALRQLVKVKSVKNPHFLAVELENMLKDRGEGTEAWPNLEEFWKTPDAEVQRLKQDVETLLDDVRYRDGLPFILASRYGNGKVVTVMSTAGYAWNGWSGKNLGSYLYEPFIVEMHNYLSPQGRDVNLTLGSRLEVNVNSQPFEVSDKLDTPFKMIRSLLKSNEGAKANREKDLGQSAKAKDRKLTFVYPSTIEPGIYLTELHLEKKYDDWAKTQIPEKKSTKKAKDKKDDAKEDKKVKDDKKAVKGATEDAPKDAPTSDGPKPLWTSASVFNIDTVAEGNLERVAYEFIKFNILDKSEKRILFSGTDVPPSVLVPTRKDLSELPLFFLLFLTVLVAEQALAVHLSFHLKGNETFAPAGQARPTIAA